MTSRMKANELGLDSHWKIRVVADGALLHFASYDEPVWHPDLHMATWQEPIHRPEYGDTLGYIDWRTVTAVSWRWSA